MPLPPYALPSWYRYCGAAVAPVDTARDLGVRLDAQLTLDEHMDSVVRSCFYQLRQLRSIGRSLTGDALLTPSSPAASTTVTPSCTVSPATSYGDYSRSSMRLRD